MSEATREAADVMPYILADDLADVGMACCASGRMDAK